MTVMITGGAGYIGSHCCVTFLEAGFDLVVVDTFENSSRESLRRVAEICGRSVAIETVDVRDQTGLERILRQYDCTSVVHFAGLKVVGESIDLPLDYYDVNVVGTYRLVSAMRACGVHTLIFSSSANVYGEPVSLPLDETHRTAPMSPYGRTKLIVETMLQDVAASDPAWRIAALRYFNPVGAHESGLIGESPLIVPTNLMPIICQTASGQRPSLSVFGTDYDTPDGTGIRDYIHVVDLVEGHLAAHRHLAAAPDGPNCLTFNLGTGEGYSVLEMIRAFERASNRTIAYESAERRPGDVAVSFADTGLAERTLRWTAARGLDAMCRDTWNWVCKNPTGYRA
ncbi:MAG: UDP-glucose 4-epimerase GalE [Roseibium sp.]|nr:UDP-glucose 4-epimerase GalE [Roseibium sp.]